MGVWDKFAPNYDRLAPGIKGDLEFYLHEAKKVRGKVLEVACGTGRVLLPLAKAGVDITGVDSSRGMLGVLRGRMGGFKKKPMIVCADMRSFRLKERFDLVIIPYRAFLHMETQEDQLRALKNFHKHLSPKGRLVLNFFVPSHDFIVKYDGKRFRQKERDWVDRKTGNRVRVFYHQKYDRLDQLSFWTNTLEEVDRKGRVVKRTSLPGSLRYIFKNEFELLLRAGGFSRWRAYGGFKRQRLTSKSKEMVWIAEK